MCKVSAASVYMQFEIYSTDLHLVCNQCHLIVNSFHNVLRTGPIMSKQSIHEV